MIPAPPLRGPGEDSSEEWLAQRRITKSADRTSQIRTISRTPEGRHIAPTTSRWLAFRVEPVSTAERVGAIALDLDRVQSERDHFWVVPKHRRGGP
jgi:hypothetical protein